MQLKLNYRRIFAVGFAFLLIQTFWGAYEVTIPNILLRKFGMSQTGSGVVMSLDNLLAVFMLPLFGAFSDKINTRYGRRTPFIVVGTILAAFFFVWTAVVNSLWLFLIVLLATLIAMATFRSPAVALMPDVTVKPLRSKANAVINLMGAIGTISAMILGIVFNTSEKGKTDFVHYFIAIGAFMMIALIIFLIFVRENQWAQEMRGLTEKYDLDAESEERKEHGGKLSRGQLTSLIFLLSSVVLWFTGYNAITSKLSPYVGDLLKYDYNVAFIIANGAAIVSFIPVGILSTKIGRKKAIIAGVSLLTVSFFIASFIRADSPSWLLYGLLGLVGIAWATINVNSFPMVVELAHGSDVGKFTGYYYTASMAAQIITPILSGGIMDLYGWMNGLAKDDPLRMTPLFPYATVFVFLSLITMLFVKHGDTKVVDMSDYEEYDI